MSFLQTDKLVGVLDHFQQAAVRSSPEWCLNRRHKENKCELCLACPTGAVTAAATSVQVSAEKCVGCGLCASVCPTEVFAVQGPALAEVIRVCANGRGTALEVACPQRSPLGESRSPANAVLCLSCMAWLSPALLLAIMAQGVTGLWLDDTPCEKCPIGGARGTITEAVEVANRLLALMGRAPAIFLYSANQVGLGKARNLEVWDPLRPAYSRRDLFTAFRRVAAQTAATVADQALPTPAPAKLAQRIPAQRALLSVALPRLLMPGTAAGNVTGLPLARVEVSEACTACGLCARVCPTAALTFAQDEGTYALTFTASKCLGDACRVCRLICPMQAVSLAEQAVPADLLGEMPLMLRAGRLVACTGCNQPTAAPVSGEAVCHACQWRKRLGVAGATSLK